jgi:nucleoside-diphosphate-sugar epimerase
MPAEVDYRRIDLAEGGALEGLGAGITHVFHLAGASSSLSSTEDMHQSNVVATNRLLSSLVDGDTHRLVYLSSTSIYGEEEQLPLPVSEDVDPHPSRGYGKAKWQAEQAVWSAGESGLAVSVVRPVTVYGPGNVKLLGSAVLDTAIERYAGLGRLVVHDEPVEQRLVHVDDVVHALLHLAGYADAAGKAFNLVLPDYPTSHRIVEILGALFDLTPELAEDPEAGPTYEQRSALRSEMLAKGMQPDILLTKERFRFLRKANRNNRLSVDALMSTGFRFEHTDLEASIAQTVKWYMEHRWIPGDAP